MIPTPIHNTLYGRKNWRLANANTHRIEPDAAEPDTPEGYSRYWPTIAAGTMEPYGPESKRVPLYMSPPNIVIWHEQSSIWNNVTA